MQCHGEVPQTELQHGTLPSRRALSFGGWILWAFLDAARLLKLPLTLALSVAAAEWEFVQCVIGSSLPRCGITKLSQVSEDHSLS